MAIEPRVAAVMSQNANQDPRLKAVWHQKLIPVAFRQPGRKPVLLRLPFDKSNREWLKEGHRNQPNWNQQWKCWELPKAWFEDVVKRSLVRYGKIYVIHPFQVQQKCAPACWDAVGLDCECSCMGANHGSGNPPGKWYVVSETCAVHWSERQYSCRLLTSTTPG